MPTVSWQIYSTKQHKEVCLWEICYLISFFILLLSVFVLIALFAAVVALVIAHRQKQLSAGLKAILISVVVLCVLYLLFMVSLVFLFDSSPPASPVPYTP